MTPAPTLEELVACVETDAPGGDPLDLLAQASRTTADLESLADALLGHFVDRCRRAGYSWSEISGSLGVSKQAAHKRFSAPTFERFTPRARSVLRGASDEARSLSVSYVGTEHLLLALFGQTEGLAAQALAEAGITREMCEEKVRARTRPGTGTPPASESMPFTPKAAESLRSAVEEALRLGHNYIGTEHLLLGLFSDPKAMSAEVLGALGVTYDDMRLRLTAKLATYLKPEGPPAN